MKWLTLLALAATPAMGMKIIAPKMANVTWQIHLSADSNLEATYGSCSIEYKGIVLANRAFEGKTSFDIKGTFLLRSNVREVQVRCAVKGFNTYTETVAVTNNGVRVDHCLDDNARIYQNPKIDLDQGVARVRLKIPQFRQEKVLINNKTFLKLTTPDNDVSSSSYSGRPYLPELPQTSFYLALPLDAQVASIKVVPGPLQDGINMLLVPKADDSVGDINPIATPIYNDKIYTSRDQEILVERDASFKSIINSERNLVRVSVPLVDYSVKKENIRFYNDADVIITFKAASKCFRKPFWGRDAVDTLRASSLVGLSALVLNPNDIQTVCRGGEPTNGGENPIGLRSTMMRAIARTAGPNLVIITDPRFHAQAVDLAAHKETLGIRTAVVDWTAGSTPQDMRALLQKAADSLRPNYMQWVLLLGDTDSIPTYYDDAPGWSEIGDAAHTAGDAFYVQWNPETYQPTLDPSASIGRIPAKTPEELKVVIERIKNYDNNPPMSDTFYTAPTIAATLQLKADNITGLGGNYAYNAEQKLSDKFFAAGFHPERFYRADKPNVLRPTYWQGTIPIDYDRLMTPQPEAPTVLFHLDTTQDAINGAIERGTNMLVHRGHGAVDQWIAPAYRFDAQRFSVFPNNMPPVVFALSCLTGFFDNETVHNGHILAPTSDVAPTSPEQRYLGEQMLLAPNGALGVVASSRQSSGPWNKNMTVALARSVVERKAEDNSQLSQRVGDIMTDTKIYAHKLNLATGDAEETAVDNRHHMLAYNLLGDPSVEMRQSLPIVVRNTPTLQYDAERATLTIRFRIESVACTLCDLSKQKQQPIAVLMGNENQPVSRGVANVITAESGENREVVLTGVPNFESVNYTLYLSNAGLATFKMKTGPSIPVIR